MWIYLLFIGIFGLCVGSFLNVLIDRLPRGGSIRGRSYCPHCRKILQWYELIPLLSFIFLKGKCRSCKKPISWQCPIIEFFTGCVFTFVFWHLFSGIKFYAGQWPDSAQWINLFFYLFFVSILIVIFAADLRYYIVPDTIIYPAIVFALLFQIVSILIVKHSLLGIQYSIYSAFGAALFFLFLIFISKGRGMGFGDVKIAAFMGFLLGFPNILVALFLSFFSGAIVGSVLILAKRKKLKSKVPFGCFLAPSTFIALFWGEQLVEWYIKLI